MTFRFIGMKCMYFALEKDINFGGPVVECYGLNIYAPPIHKLKSIPNVMVLGSGAFWR